MNVFQSMEQWAGSITVEEVICLAGLILLACWLLKTSLGRYALADSVLRRNNMPFYMPLIPLLSWFWFVSLGNWLIGKFRYQLPSNQWQSAFYSNLVLGISEVMTIVVMIFLVRVSFARRLRGFGLNVKTIPRDFLVSIVNLLSIWPLVVLMVISTRYFGRHIWGQDYEIQRHEQLISITAYHQISFRILVFIVTVVIAAVFEEMLFRGLFQTMLRSFLGRPWVSILISSALFVSVHQRGHWSALFVLAICLGYAYEKSGSLFRPIFIHAFFNAVTIVAALNIGNQ